MMPRGNELLLPVNPIFIWFSLLMALSLNMLPLGPLRRRCRISWRWPGVLERAPAAPGRRRRRLRFRCLAMDVHQGALLGQHALAYTLLSFFAITMHRRLLWFTVPSQAVQILPLFVAAHAVTLLVRMIAGGSFPGWGLLLAPYSKSLLWPVVAVVLLAPQRRAPDPTRTDRFDRRHPP
jgi:rod shape-determining protein MreD